MAAEERKQNTAVEERIFKEGYRFNFFKAVHLLERMSGGRSPGKGFSPLDDPLAFRVRPGFGFPASDIAAVSAADGGQKPQMNVTFMGLIGPKGVLPDWYNTHADHLRYKKQYAFTDFLDMFHHRLLSLFYLAWKKYRLAENYQADGSDVISQCLADFVGLDPHELERDPAFYRFARKDLIYFAGMVSRCVPTASAIETVVSHIIAAPARIAQFAPRMMALHEHDRTALGRANSTLKVDALCGSRIQDVTTCFIVRLGPLSWEKYLRFAPRSKNLGMIHQLVARMAGLEYEFSIELIIKGPEIPCLSLGGKQGAPLLGRTVLLRRFERPYEKNITVKTTQPR